MIPSKTIEELILKHSTLEKELSSGDIDKKLFAEKSKEYSDVNEIIDNAKKSLLAGCNLVLYCAGNYTETLKLIKEVPYIDQFTTKKTSEFYKFLG